MSDLQAACDRLIAVAGERHDKTASVTFNGAEWEAFVAAVSQTYTPPHAEQEEPPAEEEPPPEVSDVQ